MKLRFLAKKQPKTTNKNKKPYKSMQFPLEKNTNKSLEFQFVNMIG
jgi:hypothetical protein